MSLFDGFVKHYQEELNLKLKSLEDTLLNGNFDKLEDYKRVVGERKGVLFALDRHRELVNNLEND